MRSRQSHWIKSALALSLVVSCNTVSAEQPAPVKSLPDRAFEILKSNDAESLPDVGITLALGRILAKSETKPIADDRVEAVVKDSMDKLAKSFRKVREATEKAGFDWPNARLEKTTVGIKQEPYDPASTQPMLDLYIHIKSGDKSILIKLDDCPLIAGQRRIGDGFRLMKETP